VFKTVTYITSTATKEAEKLTGQGQVIAEEEGGCFFKRGREPTCLTERNVFWLKCKRHRDKHGDTHRHTDRQI
jgi:hypothetical protein